MKNLEVNTYLCNLINCESENCYYVQERYEEKGDGSPGQTLKENLGLSFHFLQLVLFPTQLLARPVSKRHRSTAIVTLGVIVSVPILLFCTTVLLNQPPVRAII